MFRLAEDLISLADKRKIVNKGRFVKEVFKSDLDFKSLATDDTGLKKLEKPQDQSINTDVYYQLNDYIECKRKMVCKSTLAIFSNLGEQLRDFEAFRKVPITFDGIDFNFYDNFVKFLTFDYVQKRRKKAVKGLKQNSV